jgi:hypothetical protein
VIATIIDHKIRKNKVASRKLARETPEAPTSGATDLMTKYLDRDGVFEQEHLFSKIQVLHQCNRRASNDLSLLLPLCFYLLISGVSVHVFVYHLALFFNSQSDIVQSSRTRTI